MDNAEQTNDGCIEQEQDFKVVMRVEIESHGYPKLHGACIRENVGRQLKAQWGDKASVDGMKYDESIHKLTFTNDLELQQTEVDSPQVQQMDPQEEMSRMLGYAPSTWTGL